MKINHFEVLKWIAAGCYLFPTFLMLNPVTASSSIVPWIFYLIGNAIWSIDSFKTRNIPWIVLSLIFIAMDIILIVQRLNVW